MALTESAAGLSPADVAAVVGRNGNGGWGFGNDGGAWWLLILFLFAFNNGGNLGNNGGGLQADMQRGFDQQATTGAISNLSSQVGNGFADAAVARCAGDAQITAAITGGQYATAQAITSAKDTLATTLNTNNIANIQSQNSLAMALQNCCCENRAGLADLKYTVATENCADRQAISDGLRDVIANNTANTNAIIQSQQQGFQAVQDKLCQMEIDNLKNENQNLRSQLNMAGLAASQTAQTAALIQDNNAQTAALINRIAPAAIPAYQVPNPYTGYGVGYGMCGCGN